MIAGEGLVGILLAILAVLGVEKWLNLSESFHAGSAGGLIALAAVVLCLLRVSRRKK